jgi:hypothetical protein
LDLSRLSSHGYRDVAAYWQKLKDDIEWEVQ